MKPILARKSLYAGAVALLLAAALGGTAALRAADTPAPAAAAASPAKAALTVTLVSPQRGDWPQTLSANGDVAAWQEAVIGAETQGLRLVEVAVQVGDRVRRGQTLARLQSQTSGADVAISRANLLEAKAALAEAQANAERARQLEKSGALSTQQILQLTTAEQTAKARLAGLQARLEADQVRLSQTRIVAPDDGVISASSATVGAVVSPGQELFRLIRRERLEWRAQVPSSDLAAIRPGMPVTLTAAGAMPVSGTVRQVAPTVDPATRNGLVYVDLPKPGAVRAGMFARGEFETGRASGVTLPQSAVVLRDGFSYVFEVDAQGRVSQRKVSIGRRLADRIEITDGLAATARVVEQGGGFLADGDTVRVVEARAATAAPAR